MNTLPQKKENILIMSIPILIDDAFLLIPDITFGINKNEKLMESMRYTKDRAFYSLRIMYTLLKEIDVKNNIIEQNETILNHVMDGLIIIEQKVLFHNDLDEMFSLVLYFSKSIANQFKNNLMQLKNEEMRSKFKKFGLHGMFDHQKNNKIFNDEDDGDITKECIICRDNIRTTNFSSLCTHEFILCSNCITRMDKCPVCSKA